VILFGTQQCRKIINLAFLGIKLEIVAVEKWSGRETELTRRRWLAWLRGFKDACEIGHFFRVTG